jgi:hypothetical protein
MFSSHYFSHPPPHLPNLPSIYQLCQLIQKIISQKPKTFKKRSTIEINNNFLEKSSTTETHKTFFPHIIIN